MGHVGQEFEVYAGDVATATAAAVSALSAALTDREADVREAVLVGLANFPTMASPALVDRVSRAAEDPDPRVRRASIAALRAFGPKTPLAVVGALVRVIAAPGAQDDELVKMAIEGLADCGQDAASEAVDTLAVVVRDDRLAADTRVAACKVLGGLGPDAKPASDALAAVVIGAGAKSTTAEVRVAAAQALIRVAELSELASSRSTWLPLGQCVSHLDESPDTPSGEHTPSLAQWICVIPVFHVAARHHAPTARPRIPPDALSCGRRAPAAHGRIHGQRCKAAASWLAAEHGYDDLWRWLGRSGSYGPRRPTPLRPPLRAWSPLLGIPQPSGPFQLSVSRRHRSCFHLCPFPGDFLNRFASIQSPPSRRDHVGTQHVGLVPFSNCSLAKSKRTRDLADGQKFFNHIHSFKITDLYDSIVVPLHVYRGNGDFVSTILSGFVVAKRTVSDILANSEEGDYPRDSDSQDDQYSLAASPTNCGSFSHPGPVENNSRFVWGMRGRKAVTYSKSTPK